VHLLHGQETSICQAQDTPDQRIPNATRGYARTASTEAPAHPKVLLRGLAYGTRAPQANGGGEMRVGDRREADSEPQRQQIVSPPTGRGWRFSRWTRSWGREIQRTMLLTRGPTLRVCASWQSLSAGRCVRSKKSAIYIDTQSTTPYPDRQGQRKARRVRATRGHTDRTQYTRHAGPGGAAWAPTAPQGASMCTDARRDFVCGYVQCA